MDVDQPRSVGLERREAVDRLRRGDDDLAGGDLEA
jgi:hypothetical protein